MCAGQEVSFECIVESGGGTFWVGTSLAGCTNENILILHSEHNSRNNYSETCERIGPILIQPVSAVNNLYTSHFTILNVSQNLNGSTIGCESDSGLEIGLIPVILSTGKKNSHNIIIMMDKKHYFK